MQQLVAALLALIWAAQPCARPWAFDEAEVFQGGAMSTRVFTEKAYSQFPRQLGFIEQGNFKLSVFFQTVKSIQAVPSVDIDDGQFVHFFRIDLLRCAKTEEVFVK